MHQQGPGGGGRGGHGGYHKKPKTKTNPLAAVYRFFQARIKCEIWLYDNNEMRIEAKIIGFDEYMNMVLEEAVEVTTKNKVKSRKEIGRILLKGENISLIRNLGEVSL